jgi:hypothetical protein
MVGAALTIIAHIKRIKHFYTFTQFNDTLQRAEGGCLYDLDENKSAQTPLTSPAVQKSCPFIRKPRGSNPLASSVCSAAIESFVDDRLRHECMRMHALKLYSHGDVSVDDDGA